MPIFTRQRFSKWPWIVMVIAFIGFFRLYDDFELMIVLALVGGLFVLFVKAFIWAARNNKGTLLYDKDGKWYRAFEVGEDHDWMDDHCDSMRPTYSFRHHDEED